MSLLGSNGVNNVTDQKLIWSWCYSDHFFLFLLIWSSSYLNLEITVEKFLKGIVHTITVLWHQHFSKAGKLKRNFKAMLELTDGKLRPWGNMIPRWFVLKSKSNDCLLLKELWLPGMLDWNPDQLSLNDKLIVVCIFDNAAICLSGYNTVIPLSFISRESPNCLFLGLRFGTVAVMLCCAVADSVVKIPPPSSL